MLRGSPSLWSCSETDAMCQHPRISGARLCPGRLFDLDLEHRTLFKLDWETRQP